MSMEDLVLDLTPQLFLIWSLRLIGLIAAIVNSFGIYVILRFSSREIKTYKYYQLTIQILSTLVDIWISFAMEPIPLFPLIAGYCEGFMWSIFHIRSHLLMVTILVLMCAQMSSMICGFLYKHQAISFNNEWYKLSNIAYYIALTFICLIGTTIIPTLFFLSEISPMEQKRLIETEYPDQRQLLKLENLNIYDPRYNIYIQYFFIFLISVIGLVIFLISFITYHIYHILEKQQQFMSKRIHKMHKSTFISLLLQVTVPLICYVVPIVIVVSVMIFEIENVQGWCNAMILFFSFHATIASIIMMSTAASYRNGIKRRAMQLLNKLFGMKFDIPNADKATLFSHVTQTTIFTTRNSRIN